MEVGVANRLTACHSSCWSLPLPLHADRQSYGRYPLALCQKCLARVHLVAPQVTHIGAAGMAHVLSARAHPACGMIRDRIPRDVRSRSVMRRLSCESGAASFSRERDGVGERELRRGWVLRSPSGESAGGIRGVVPAAFEVARSRRP